jgi:hypothetical protein
MLALATAAAADAELRTGTQTDPADVPGADGDIEFARGFYDTDAGVAGVVVGFVRPLAPPVMSAIAGVDVTMTGGGPDVPGGCGYRSYIIYMQTYFGPDGSVVPGVIPTIATGSAGPYVGSGMMRTPATASWSADGRELTTSMNVGPGHDLRCFTAETRTAGNLAADRLEAPGYFDGFRPTACDDGLDNDHDGNRDRMDPECRTGSTETDPSKVATRARLRVRPVRCGVSGTSQVAENPPSDLDPLAFRFYGRLRINVRGLSRAVRGTRRTLSAAGTPYPKKQFVIRRLRAGRYRVSFNYTGDKWRNASATVSRTVRVACR